VESHFLITKIPGRRAGEVHVSIPWDGVLLTRHNILSKAPEWKRAYMYVFL